MVTFMNHYNSNKIFLVLGIILRVTPHSCRSPLECKNGPPADRKVIEATGLFTTTVEISAISHSQISRTDVSSL